MLQDGKAVKSPTPADLDQIAAQITSLREELTRLSHAAAETVDRRGRKMASDIADGFGEAVHYVERKGKSAEDDLELSVAKHPFLALGLAAGAGLLIGMMTRR
jgi:ElaB/YqjD/DUF883 family membrane-anchored ribosome-binding protein